jgi:hypothetical protein
MIKFPKEDPKRHENTTKVAYLGIKLKQTIKITTLEFPPPRPTSELRPLMVIIKTQPASSLIPKLLPDSKKGVLSI